MKFLKKLTNRYNILIIILTILMGALTLRLATLTIAHGDYYRNKSDNVRMRTISTTAARGEIRDKYGRLLAGSKPTFTVQLLKDELSIKEKDEKNQGLLELIRLLEEDGVDYVDEFPIDLNVFAYIDENLNVEEISPMDRIVDIIIENQLLSQLLLEKYNHVEYSEHYEFTIVERAIYALNSKGIKVPINIIKNPESIGLEFDTSKNIVQWKEEYGIHRDASPLESLVFLIQGDKTNIRKIIDHPISRKLIYEKLKPTGLINNIELREYTFLYDDEYYNQKKLLSKAYNGITMETSARNDFLTVLMESGSMKDLMYKVGVKKDLDEKEEYVLPGEILLEMLEDVGIEVPYTIEFNKEEKSVLYSSKDGSIPEDIDIVDSILEIAESNKGLMAFILDERVRPLAQEQLLENGINPKISISDKYEYVSINNKNRWIKSNKTKKNHIDEEGKTVEEIFNAVRERHEIDPSLSPYEARSILLIYEQLSKQGLRAYQPINIAYGIKDSTVAKIEEGMSEFSGVQVSIEPVRFYPEGSSAAHILGYLGKISQPSEIEKYVDELEYSPNDIIGKTGIEESYEETLRGENGIKRVEVDVFGNTTEVLGKEKPIPGDNIYLTIDLNLQKEAERALEKTLKSIQVGGVYESKWGNYQMGRNNKQNRPYKNANSGAVVAIDVKTNQVLAMASYPDYDLNLFSTGISSADWQSLFPENEKDLLAPRPLYNVATQTAVQPGSTFKMVTALAGLEKGLSPEKKIRDMGYVKLGQQEFRCHVWKSRRGTHGPENVYEALRDSCNYYFYTLALGRNQRTGENLGVKVEIEDIVEMSTKLGLNDKTGIEINIPAEFSGGVPNPEKKIAATQSLLRRFLERDIADYLYDDVEKTEEEIEEMIEHIVSWSDEEIPMTRGEVYRALREIGVDPDKKIKGNKQSVTDIIKYQYLYAAGWSMADTLNITIGQGENAYTPLQMANAMAIIANDGYRRRTSLVDNVKNYNNSEVLYENNEEHERIPMNNYDNFSYVRKGMGLVSSDGTARRVFSNFPVPVGSKTGTAEKSGRNPDTGENYDDFGSFVAFAPYDDPEIAIYTILFQGGSGGNAAPMTRDIIAEYLGLNAVETKEGLPFKNTLSQ